jgi:mannan endo-1,4-beta-mannosidase
MKFSSVISVLSALAVANVQATPAAFKHTKAHPIVPTRTSSPSSAFTSYAKAEKNVLSINGKAEYFMGTNSYWIGFLTNNSDVDTVMSHLATV